MSDGKFLSPVIKFKQPEEDLKECLGQLGNIPITCTLENAGKTPGQAEKCMTQYIMPTATCLDLALPADRRQKWAVDLPKYFSPYYKLMPLVYKRLSESSVNPFVARNFVDAINGIYLASIAHGKPEVITGIAAVLENLAKAGNLSGVINYVQTTQVKDVAPELPPTVEFPNRNAIMLYVWAGQFAWPGKREAQLFTEAIWMFPPLKKETSTPSHHLLEPQDIMRERATPTDK